MTTERWHQISHLFDAVLACEPPQRAAFLAERCDGDDSLRQEVEFLVQSYERERASARGSASPADDQLHDQISEPANSYQAYQLSRYYYHNVSFPDMAKSRFWLEESLRFDEDFAPAHIALAEQCVMEAITGLRPPDKNFPLARTALRRAVELESDSAELYMVAGFVDLICDWNFAGAERNVRRALELNQHHAFAHKYLGEVLMFQGRMDEAVSHLREAQRIDPMNLHVGVILTMSYFLARDYQSVLTQCEQFLGMYPSFVPAAWMRCWALEQTGRAGEALVEYEKILRQPGGEIARRYVGYAYALAGDRENALKIAAQLDEQNQWPYLSPTHQAQIYAALNEPDTAFSYLEKGLTERDPWMLWIATDPRFDKLRSDSRFEITVGRVGLRLPPAAPPAATISSERWQRIDELFHGALARNPEERARFLVKECEGDESLRLEVESLLASYDEAQDFIEAQPADIAAEMFAARKSRFESGQRIGNYQIVRHLGSGGMGEVYLADDVRLNREVALKLLPSHFTGNSARVHRFEREARAASALNHPNIVTIYEIGQSSSAHFIAAEFVDGKTLRELINERPFKLSESINTTLQVAGALAAAHAAGIVHRDVKPENIMIRGDGYVKILDFGLAKLTDPQLVQAESETPTWLQSNPGLVMGTVQYMSPEQARGTRVDARTDIWSLGIVLYELLTGRVPFSGETPSHVMVSLMEDELPPLETFPNVPVELARIVARSLRKDLKQRYQTTAELVRDLREFKGKLQFEALLQQPSVLDKTPVTPTSENEFAARPSSPEAIALATESFENLSSAEYIARGIRRHRRVFALAAAVLLITIATAGYFYFGRSTRARTRSLAVLPFDNAGNNPDLEYLSDGLSESLTNNLAPVPGLTVISRYSSFKYKGKQPDPQEVGKSLGVDAIVTGSVNKAGDNYVISIELINASDRSRIWGKQYNRKSADLLIVQSEISHQIADELRLRLTRTEEQQLARSEAVNPQAYDLYLKALALSNSGKSSDRKKAIEYYQQATAVDPGYALAYVDLARAYNNLITDNSLPQKEFFPKAEAAAQKAMEADPNLAEAHLVVALIMRNKWEWSAAETELKRALELNPNLVQAHNAYAAFLIIHGRIDEAVTEMNRAQQLDPLRMSVAQSRVDILGMYRQDDQALEGAKQILQANPNLSGAHIRVGEFYARLGRNAEAIDSFLEAIRLGDDSGDAQILLGWAYAKGGQRAKAREIQKRFETGELYSSPFGLAMLDLAFGDVERMYARLEEAYAMRDQQLIWLRGAWEFDSIRSDPRFEDLVRRIGL